MPRIEQVVPILRVGDVTASIAYHRERLGFEQTFGYGDPPGFGGAERDGVEIFFCRRGQGHPGTWVSVWVDTATHQLRVGGREMRVGDPDGHRLRFSMVTDQPADGVPFVED
jgi:hypothetical protein